ncbi:MAG: heparinase II/III family protein [Planctomycetes bacterium]|nr:heparinase II/III family protein [Planctomycetota bacterium]
MLHNTCSIGSCLLALVCAVGASADAVAENLSLAQRYPKDELNRILLPRSQWRPFPKADQRAAWEQLPDDQRKTLVAVGEECAGIEVPNLPATLYLEFRREGNRSRYQDVWMVRRKLLNSLALAECVEGKGRFLDPLVNVAWAICEESSWTWPAHISAQKAGSGLPDATEPVVALFSAETACSLAWVVYLLEEQLDGVSPLICRRIRREIDERILTPYLERDDFRWMGFGSRGRPNNWNPWVNSNVLASALLLEEDDGRRLETVHKVLRCLDNFFTSYPEDGSCDEGPSYWTRAGASLFDNLELLYGATSGRFDVYDDETVRNIGRFIYRAHITGRAYVCVGDCDAEVNIPRDLVYRYGERIGDADMQALATFDMSGSFLWQSERGLWSMMRPLYALFNLSTLRAVETPSAPLLCDAWLGNEDMQLMAARDDKGTSKGFFVAGWGGHNAQSHNHNDVGNYVVYVDGLPALIDVGRPTYTRQTFSRDRYKIWAMQSAFHNLPTVNGHMQGVGRQFAARDVRYRFDESLAELQLNIAPAYPKEAGIASWSRSIRLERGRSVTISDTFELREESAAIVQSLMTPWEVSPVKAGQLEFSHPDADFSVIVRYEPPRLDVEVETIELEDEKLAEMWGPSLQRVLLKADAATSGDTWTVRISKAD